MTFQINLRNPQERNLADEATIFYTMRIESDTPENAVRKAKREAKKIPALRFVNDTNTIFDLL